MSKYTVTKKIFVLSFVLLILIIGCVNEKNKIVESVSVEDKNLTKLNLLIKSFHEKKNVEKKAAGVILEGIYIPTIVTTCAFDFYSFDKISSLVNSGQTQTLVDSLKANPDRTYIILDYNGYKALYWNDFNKLADFNGTKSKNVQTLTELKVDTFVKDMQDGIVKNADGTTIKILPNETVQLIGSADFSDGKLTPKSIYPGTSWGSGSQAGGTISIENGAYKAHYPISTGGVYSWLNFNPPANTRELYVEFKAKFSVGHSMKFFKIHGIRDSGGYANTTYGLGSNGIMSQISFGDGSEPNLDNDTGNVINLGGDYPSWVGRSYSTTAKVKTPQNASFNFGDGLWHNVRIHHKFNSGTSATDEIADGSSYLEIDGKVYSDTTGLFNRRWSNSPIDHICFGDWAQEPTVPFDVYYDDIKFSTGGFVNESSTNN